MARLQEALRYIPRQMDYDDWLHCLMAVHSEYPGDDGIALCESWSPGYPGEIERKFASFNTNGNGAGRVGVGTLFEIAKRHGYQPPQIALPEIIYPSTHNGHSERAPVAISNHADTMPPLPENAHIDTELAEDASPWLDGYVKFSRKWSPRSFDGFHEAVGLWVLSTVAARRIVGHFGGKRFTNLQIALAAPTSTGAKSTAAKIGMGALADAGLLYLMAPDDATPQAFIHSLAARLPTDWGDLPRERQLQILERLAFAGQKGWFFDEFGQKVSAMMRDGGHMADFRGLLRKFDDNPDTYEYKSIQRGSDLIHAPYLALLTSLTPADLRPFAKPNSALWRDGFWARFAFITPPKDAPQMWGRFPDGARSTPAKLVMALREWHNRLGVQTPSVKERQDDNNKGTGKFELVVEPASPHVVELGEGVRDAYYRYHDALQAIALAMPDDDLSGNYLRFSEKALRIALLLGSLENHDHVTIRHWARAQQIAESWRQYLHNLYAEVTDSRLSRGEQVEDKIIKLIGERGPMTKREIYQSVRGLDSGNAGAVLQSMVSTELLDVQIEGRTQRYSIVG